jgi:glycosyltransferase involved in cell wall biosynthesis
MKIGIIGTRGIPNQYGGFEQFIEFVAPGLVVRGHEVYVYNSSLHPYRQSQYKGVHIIRKTDPENKIGTAGQFVYDLNCILDSRKRNYDAILQLGYTSSSVWTFLYPSSALLVTNMDGLEWKRSKYSKPVQSFLRYAERWAALHSDALIADSRGIQDYLQQKYNKPSAFIAYGAIPFHDADDSVPARFSLGNYNYNLLIARMEPENNIETIIKGHLQASRKIILAIIGGTGNNYGKKLRSAYESEYIRFIGPVYDMASLNSLRYFSQLYFHGHSVGGTNPSLLEAMASRALIVAHDNVFNKSVLANDAFYFSSPAEIAAVIDGPVTKSDCTAMLNNNMDRIRNEYSWQQVTNALENYLMQSLEKHKKPRA